MDFSEQLSRIQLKLQELKKKDLTHKIFGASSHLYELGPPLQLSIVKVFEQKYNITLPDDYVAFITMVGYGGPGHYGGAGPHYGIYKLEEFGYMVVSEASLASPCDITSHLTENEWVNITAFANKEEDLDSVEYDRKYNSLFNGLMTIGTQGCSYQTMLIMNGKDKGRVVNIDQDLQMPIVCKQKNFLDWYEHWLDASLNEFIL